MPDDIINDVIQSLVKKKEENLKRIVKSLKGGVKPLSVDELLKTEQSERKIKTGTLIDELIGGGLAEGSSMLFFGEYGSGKTQTCLTMAVECDEFVIFIDTEGSFRATRLKEIAESRGKNWEEVSKRVILYKPRCWIEQMETLFYLPTEGDLGGKVGLIIVDSLTKMLRGIEFAGRQELGTKQPLVREFIFHLEEIIKLYGSALIYTTQIYESPKSNPFLPDWTGHKAVGGSSLLHQPDYVVFLRKGQGNVRIARLTDASSVPLAERPFMLSEKGVEDIPSSEKGEKLLEKTKKYEEKLGKVLEDTKKKKGEGDSSSEDGKEEETGNNE